LYITYLFKNRKKNRFISLCFLKSTIKRSIYIGSLFKAEFNKIKLNINGVTLGDLSVISSDCKLNGKYKNLLVGSNVFIGASKLMLHGKIDIGDFSVINDEVKIITASHDINDSHWDQFSRNVTIGKYVWIATGAIILPGVKIGNYAVIGAGAVIGRDVNDYEVVVGNPGKVIKVRNKIDYSYSPVDNIALFNAWLK
jgi:acetyltransferase-like isoleucine patch superfamily enzyme